MRPSFLIACALLAVCALGTPSASQTLVPAGAAPANDGGASGATVEVLSRSAVTVVGRFESLNLLIEELCEKSDVVLRTYTAPDRPVVARYENMPLRDVFERLLSRESFALGFTRRQGAGRERITWMRVVSSRASKARNEGPTLLPRTAFTSPNADVRRRATFAFASRLRRQSAFRDQFLRTGARRLLSQLEGGPHAAEFLGALRRQLAEDRRLRAKILLLLRELRR